MSEAVTLFCAFPGEGATRVWVRQWRCSWATATADGRIKGRARDPFGRERHVTVIRVAKEEEEEEEEERRREPEDG